LFVFFTCSDCYCFDTLFLQYLSTEVSTAIAQDRDLVITLRGAGLLLSRAHVFPSFGDRLTVSTTENIESKNSSNRNSLISLVTTEEDVTITTNTPALAVVPTEETIARVGEGSDTRGNSTIPRWRLEKQRVWWRLSIEDPCACLGLVDEGTGNDRSGSDTTAGHGSSNSSNSSSGGAHTDSTDRFGGVMMMYEYDHIDGDLGATLSLDTQLRTFRALERAAR
jgi:hypothetical protein